MSRSAITVSQLATDPRLLGGVFAAPSYRPMVACLKAALGEPLDAEEREHFDQLAGGRALPPAQVAELAIIAGRGAGKTQAAALVVLALALCRECTTAPGQVPVALLLAADREQARVAFRFLVGLLQASEALASEVANVTRHRIELRNGVEIHVAASDFRSVRGRSLIAVVCDELAFWPVSADAANPDSEVLAAVRPGLARMPGSMLVAISSAYARRGELFRYFADYYGKDDPHVLVLKGGTRDFNATFPQAEIDRAMARDPAHAAAEYLSEFRSDLEAYVSRDVIESAQRPSPLELAPLAAHRYHAFADPSGGGADAFTLAIGHVEGQRVIVDLVRERKGAPAAIVREYADLLKSYNVRIVSGDRYAGQWPAEEFARHGIDYEPASKPKSDLYIDALAMLNSGRVELPPYPKVLTEYVTLERRTSRGGRDSIDHPPRCHDDVANACAGLIAMGRERSGKSAYTYGILHNISGPDDRTSWRLRYYAQRGFWPY